MRTPNPNSDPRPHRQPREPTADPTSTPGGGRSRRARPTGPPGFTFEVELVGGEEGRRLEQAQTEAIREVLAWFAAIPHPHRRDSDTSHHRHHHTIDDR